MPIETKRTFCRFCHASCAIEVDVDDNRVVAVRGDQADPIFGGYTCVKGRHLGDQHHHPDRLRTALKRRPEGGFEEIPTSRALDEIAERLQAIVAEHGPRAVASYSGTAVYGNAVGLPAARAFHKALGSPSFYTSLTIDQPGKILVPLRHGSWAAGHQPFSTADVSLVIGQNVPVSLLGYPGGPTAVDPIVTVRQAKKRGWKLIVIDPRRTEMATSADLFLQVRPGEDPTLLAGLLRVILDEGRNDAEFCARWVRGLDDLHAAVRAFDLDHVADQTGVGRDDIVLAARLFADGPRGSATCGTGPNMAPHGGLTEHLVTCLNTVCGRYPREGEVLANPGGILGWKKPWAPPKAQAISPIPAVLTSGEPARVRGLHARIGEGPTAALPDEILEPGEGQVRALLTVGGNPVLAWPDQVKTVLPSSRSTSTSCSTRSCRPRLASPTTSCRRSSPSNGPTPPPPSTGGSTRPTCTTRRPCWRPTTSWWARASCSWSWPPGWASSSSCPAAGSTWPTSRHPTTCSSCATRRSGCPGTTCGRPSAATSAPSWRRPCCPPTPTPTATSTSCPTASSRS